MTTDSMPTTAVDVVRRLYRLFGEGRLDETYALMSEDVVLREPGDPRLVPWAGEHRGHEGLGRFYRALGETLESISIDPESLQLFEVEGDRVLALGTERGTASTTGRSYETSSAWLWTLDGDRITGLDAFHDTEAMTRALAG